MIWKMSFFIRFLLCLLPRAPLAIDRGVLRRLGAAGTITMGMGTAAMGTGAAATGTCIGTLVEMGAVANGMPTGAART